jgi:hypothetical protein
LLDFHAAFCTLRDCVGGGKLRCAHAVAHGLCDLPHSAFGIRAYPNRFYLPLAGQGKAGHSPCGHSLASPLPPTGE